MLPQKWSRPMPGRGTSATRSARRPSSFRVLPVCGILFCPGGVSTQPGAGEQCLALAQAPGPSLLRRRTMPSGADLVLLGELSLPAPIWSKGWPSIAPSAAAPRLPRKTQRLPSRFWRSSLVSWAIRTRPWHSVHEALIWPRNCRTPLAWLCRRPSGIGSITAAGDQAPQDTQRPL